LGKNLPSLTVHFKSRCISESSCRGGSHWFPLEQALEIDALRYDRGDMFRLGCIYYHILIYEGKSMIFHDVMFLWYDMLQHIWTYRTAFCVHGTEKNLLWIGKHYEKIRCCVRDTVAKALNVKMLGCRSLTSIPRVGTCWDPVRKGRHFMSQDVITEHFRKAAKHCVQSMNES